MDDSDIDALATCIEIQIQKNRKRLDQLPDYSYGANVRRQTQDHIVDVGELVNRERRR